MVVDQTDADVVCACAGQRIDINYAIAIHLKRSEFMANLILWAIKIRRGRRDNESHS